MHDQNDTIAAIATARGAAPRGIVRLAGPEALEVVEQLTGQSLEVRTPRRLPNLALMFELAGEQHELPCDLFIWPDERSYTRQPAVEIHTIGSLPLLDALLRACLDAGARLAEPGEFTLRAFLAGRLDLVQAEAVLAVVDASHTALLDKALAQLAGGLSKPLSNLREELLSLLADLEAGLDFVDEEDVRFIEHAELISRIESARSKVAETAQQTQVGARLRTYHGLL